ncbi:MAG: hypothetical protein ABIO55_06545 [Ginsengibacter sp.]
MRYKMITTCFILLVAAQLISAQSDIQFFNGSLASALKEANHFEFKRSFGVSIILLT